MSLFNRRVGFYSKIKKTTTCWLWVGNMDSYGYGQYWDGERLVLSHRLMYALSIGELVKGKMILHRCDVRNCVNPKHLYQGTQKDNMRDMVSRGRMADVSGERNPRSKLTLEDVVEIRKIVPHINHPVALTHEEIARRYGVSKSTIAQISRGAIWREKQNV